ncbi:exosortase A [Novosphingobium sp.]|uniref:exosortase A n=1 Tax=Novosphingobium sp. TaxID=1874826 RepID=UPI0027337242|nr:exosortase A [Novosphingobium sp.]MDP3906089.1 exosortase A [Novosphingobium sp.]
MPPDLTAAAAPPRWPGLSIAPAWRKPLGWLALAWVLLIALFAADWAAMVDQWWNSSTYNHILLIPAILGWLVWLRWPELRKLEPQAWSPALVLVGAALLVWVAGAFAGFNLFRQAGAVALLPAAALVLLGPRVGAGLAFPLGYSLFLVPFGDELVPPLQMITADITIALVQLSGIPARIEGVFIDTPAGLFIVAEACSGVKFLIAMVALGVLVGNVCFRSWRRRAAFMALCIAAPILANGVRAWGTIYAAQYVGVEKAAGIDHIIYGWVFFAVVIAAVLGLSWKYFDRAIDDPMIDAAAIAAHPLVSRLAARRSAPLLALAAVLGLALGGQGWARAAEAIAAPLPAAIELPPVPGWTRVDYAPSVWWEPRAAGADHRLLGRYRDGTGRTVDVFLALYGNQTDGKEAGAFGEGALRPDSDWVWHSAGAPAAGAKTDWLRAGTDVNRLAHTYYRTGDLLAGSNARLKLANITDRLRLRAAPTMQLIVSAEQTGDQDAAATLASFRQSTGDPGEWMDRIAQLR